MRLKYQLFLTFLLSSIVLIALLAAFNSWSFNRGFSAYVIEKEIRRQSPTIEAIERVYSQQQNWNWVREQPELVHELIREHLSDGRASESETRKKRNGRRVRRPQKLLLIDADRQHLFGRNVPQRNVVFV